MHPNAQGLAEHAIGDFVRRCRNTRRGFDFLGYPMAKKTIANFIDKASRLYQQKRDAVSAATALEMHVGRWFGWANGGFFMSVAASGSGCGVVTKSR
jgi:hypothetical protein